MESATTNHYVNGKLTGEEHFKQVTKDAKPERELSLPERVRRLEHTVFPHLKPGEAVAETEEE